MAGVKHQKTTANRSIHHSLDELQTRNAMTALSRPYHSCPFDVSHQK